VTVDIAVAGQIREDLTEQVQSLMYGPNRGERSKVSRAIADHPPGYGYFGKGRGPVNLNIWVALVILQAHVKLRLVFLDEGHFEQQRLEFSVGGDDLDVFDLLPQAVGFVGVDVLLKVGTDSAA